MYKYFCVSDIHSFYYEFITSLAQSGFDINNADHCLVVCGDVFDRGHEAIKVYDYLKKVPANRLILIRSNHEYLYRDLLYKELPDEADFSNGTVDTFCQIANFDIEELRYAYYLHIITDKSSTYVNTVWSSIVNTVKAHEITNWILNGPWVNYFEINNYICVHSFIPLKNLHKLSIYANTNYNDYLTYFKSWRGQASKAEWYEATWGCPYKQFEAGLFEEEAKNNKILVCGHWAAEDFNRFYNHEIKNYKTYTGNNMVAIDACTAISHIVNVFIVPADA